MRSVYQHAPCGTGSSSAPKLPPILHGTSFHRDFVYLVQIRVMRLCFWCAPWTALEMLPATGDLEHCARQSFH